MEKKDSREGVSVILSQIGKNGVVNAINLGSASVETAKVLLEDLSFFNPQGLSVMVSWGEAV